MECPGAPVKYIKPCGAAELPALPLGNVEDNACTTYLFILSMMRPSEKLLRDMSAQELASESQWHAGQAAGLLEQVIAVREAALSADEIEAAGLLQTAAEKEAEAEAHIRQSNIIDTLHASKLSAAGVGAVVGLHS
jgi:hypothetical protein